MRVEGVHAAAHLRSHMQHLIPVPPHACGCPDNAQTIKTSVSNMFCRAHGAETRLETHGAVGQLLRTQARYTARTPAQQLCARACAVTGACRRCIGASGRALGARGPFLSELFYSQGYLSVYINAYTSTACGGGARTSPRPPDTFTILLSNLRRAFSAPPPPLNGSAGACAGRTRLRSTLVKRLFP